MAPDVCGLLHILAEITSQVHVALPMPCPEMIEGRLVVMGQDTYIPFQYGEGAEGIQALLSAAAVQHASLRAEIADIHLFPVQADRGRIGTDSMRIQEVVSYGAACRAAALAERSAEMIDAPL